MILGRIKNGIVEIQRFFKDQVKAWEGKEIEILRADSKTKAQLGYLFGVIFPIIGDYTGCTADLRKRFRQHNNEEVPATKGRGPFELIYYESCLEKGDAYAREKYLKSGMGKRYLKNRLKRFLSLTGHVRVYLPR